MDTGGGRYLDLFLNGIGDNFSDKLSQLFYDNLGYLRKCHNLCKIVIGR